MRTTLDIDDDVLQAAKELADLRKISAGKAVSELVRKALQSPSNAHGMVKNGVPLLRRRPGAPILTMALVNELRDQP
ncbi:antitoxin [soil metagenome]|jgi:hypothetical protein